MPVAFENGWLQNTVDHLTTERTARRLIYAAARGLTRNTSIEIIAWRAAAEGPAGVLLVNKGLHQPEGPLGDLLHMTMRLYIPGSRPGAMVPNTNFHGQFHLYTKLTNKGGLQPTSLSYRTVGSVFNTGKDFLKFDIVDADAISGDSE